MSQKETIKSILKESIDKDTITRIAVFDFDGTLVDTPLQETGKPIYEKKTGKDWPHQGWWSKPESLDMDVFDMNVIESVIEDYKKEKEKPNTLLVMMTGRIKRLSGQVEKILEANDLDFDKHIYNMGGSTLDSKISSLDKMLKDYPNVKSVAMFEDRDEHVIRFREFGTDLIDAGKLELFDVIHVKK